MTEQNRARSWFRCAAADDGAGEIVIYDEIGLFGITAKDFQTALKALGPVSDIRLSINSPGGSVFDGLAIHNMLKRHKATVTVTVDGIAASIASVIAMAGDAVLMPENAMLMIHDPSGLVVGTSKDMREIADALDKVKTGLVSAYAAKSGMDRDEIAALMSDETWLTAEEAVEMGFADEIEEPAKIAARFDLSKFRNAPAAAGRKPRSAAPAADASAKTRMEKSDMTDKKPDAGSAEDNTAAADKTAPAPAPTAETAEQMTARITAEVQKRSADIVAACALAGKPDKAMAFIAEGKSLSAAVAALQAERAASDAGEVTARNGGAKPASAEAKASWDKQVDRVNARVRAA